VSLISDRCALELYVLNPAQYFAWFCGVQFWRGLPTPTSISTL